MLLYIHDDNISTDLMFDIFSKINRCRIDIFATRLAYGLSYVVLNIFVFWQDNAKLYVIITYITVLCNVDCY